MAKRLDKPNRYGGTTDHSEEIEYLRKQAGDIDFTLLSLAFATAAELLQCHDQTGISLDDWMAPRLLVEHLMMKSVLENGV